MSPAQEDIEDLVEMPHAEFVDIVRDALMEAAGSVDDEEDWECLFHPAVLERTRAALNEIKKPISRTPKPLRGRVLAAVETRLTQAKESRKLARAREHALTMERDVSDVRNALRRLTLAVQRHRLSALAAGLDPEPTDRELWRSLDVIALHDRHGGETTSLTEMLGRGVWTEDQP